MQVPVLSIIFMFVSAVIQIGVPICLFIYFYKKYNAKILPLILGILAFVLFALVLESAIHSVVIPRFSLMTKPAVYIVYGIFMAGIFEESARFIVFNILKKKYSGVVTALSYGVGHGGIESVTLAGLSMLLSFIAAILINTGNTEVITNLFKGDALVAISSQLNALILYPPYMFLIGGLERLLAICIQISLSVIVFYSVYGKKLYLFPLAILIHAAIDFSAAAGQVGVIKSIFLIEAIVLVCAVAVAFLAKYIHDKLKPAVEEKPAENDGNNTQNN